jgi:hypothetical protein
MKKGDDLGSILAAARLVNIKRARKLLSEIHSQVLRRNRQGPEPMLKQTAT